MPIHTEYVDFIVPIARIREKYPGGWEGCLKDHLPYLGGRVWFDDELFRDSAMGPVDDILKRWQQLGFNGVSIREDTGEEYWDDVCVFEGMFGGPTLPCDWLGHCERLGAVYYRSGSVDEDQLLAEEGADVVYPSSYSVLRERARLEEVLRVEATRRGIIGYAVIGSGWVGLLSGWIYLHPDPNYYLMALVTIALATLIWHHHQV
jgi:hypothetical protein